MAALRESARDLQMLEALEAAGGSAAGIQFCIKNDEFCIQNDELCNRNDEFCIQNDEFLNFK